MKVELDASRFPVVWAVFPEDLTDEDLKAYLAASQTYLDNKQPHLLVCDLTHMGKSDEKHRRAIAKWMADHEDALRELRLGTVFVSPLAEQRRTLSGIFWHVMPPYPYFLAFDAGAAWRWADKRMGEVGLPPCSPPNSPTKTDRADVGR